MKRAICKASMSKLSKYNRPTSGRKEEKYWWRKSFKSINLLSWLQLKAFDFCGDIWTKAKCSNTTIIDLNIIKTLQGWTTKQGNQPLECSILSTASSQWVQSWVNVYAVLHTLQQSFSVVYYHSLKLPPLPPHLTDTEMKKYYIIIALPQPHGLWLSLKLLSLSGIPLTAAQSIHQLRWSTSPAF